jgi:gliding motility-associated lipoprotein GldD
MLMTKMNEVKKKRIPSFFLLFFFVLPGACNSIYTSKKKGYYKVDFPKKQYVKFDKPGFPYSFEYPVYAGIVGDSSSAESRGENPYDVNIDFPSFNGKIFISYKIIGGTSVYKVKNKEGKYRDSIGKNTFQNMVNDSYNLSYKNDIKASSIEDSVMRTPNQITGIFFRLSGNVATANQFFLSDTLHNFLRGALYFDATPNEDSLRPVDDFLQQDMKHIINTLQWQ